MGVQVAVCSGANQEGLGGWLAGKCIPVLLRCLHPAILSPQTGAPPLSGLGKGADWFRGRIFLSNTTFSSLPSIFRKVFFKTRQTKNVCQLVLFCINVYQNAFLDEAATPAGQSLFDLLLSMGRWSEQSPRSCRPPRYTAGLAGRWTCKGVVFVGSLVRTVISLPHLCGE